MTDIVMPRLSDTMEEGTILRWLKRDGEHVRHGEELAEIETDKATMAYESDRDGVLQTVAREGDTLAVGQLIARIGGDEALARDTAGTQEALAQGAGTQKTGADRSQAPTQQGAPAPDARQPTLAATAPDGPPAQGTSPARAKASPLARRIARDRGVDLSVLSGSGPGGRIVKADVEASAAGAAPATPVHLEAPAGRAPERVPEPHSEPPLFSPPQVKDIAAAKGDASVVELSRTQRTIARRMAESKATIPDFTLRVDVNMESCAQLRAELKRLSPEDAPTYNDMVVKACALALREHPRANGSYRDGHFELHSRVNVGVAVAVDADDPMRSALVVPTVLDADTKALGEIARETRGLAERVRDATITPPELSGATFTVSNLGMYGIREFTAIVNPPQAAILAVGAVEPRPALRKNKTVARHAMTVTLSCDHRILYGADAALFLARVRELLEEPAALTL